MSPVIEAEQLHKSFGEFTAVAGLDMSVKQGEIVGLIGPSGSGKTTAVRLFIGAYEPSGGVLRLWGTSAEALSTADRKRIGYLPQSPALLPDLSLHENLHFHASLHGVDGHRRAEVLASALDRVGLGDAKSTKARNASGGMRRRAALAAAQLHHPDLLVLDEPTAGIDPVLRQELWQQFEGLRDEGRTLLITTQYVGEARFCDRVAVIVDGRMLVINTPRGLHRRVHGGDVIDVELPADETFSALRTLEARMPEASVELTGRSTVVAVVEEAAEAIPAITDALTDANLSPRRVEQRRIDFDDLFVQLVKSGAEQRGPS